MAEKVGSSNDKLSGLRIQLYIKIRLLFILFKITCQVLKNKSLDVTQNVV